MVTIECIGRGKIFSPAVLEDEPRLVVLYHERESQFFEAPKSKLTFEAMDMTPQ